jgi:hypothetical protein
MGCYEWEWAIGMLWDRVYPEIAYAVLEKLYPV